MLTKMKDASLVLVQMAQNKLVNEEISVLIDKKMYNDDYIPFKDLFHPEENNTLKSANLNETFFEKEFDNIINQTTLKSDDLNDLKTYLVENNLALYVPYSVEGYPESNQTPTISFHPLINDSTNIGFKPTTQGSLKSTQVESYTQVVVDEEYSEKEPVYLIVPRPIEPTPIEPIDPDPDNSSTLPVNEVKIGYLYCTRHGDGIFEGASEIAFGRGVATRNVDGQISGVFTDMFIEKVPRQYIRDAKKNKEEGFYQVKSLFYSNWLKSNQTITVAIWEDDPKSSYEIGYSGSFKVEYKDSSGLTVSDTKTISAKTTVHTDDELYGLQEWDRDWFMITNTYDDDAWEFEGSKTREGFTYRKVGSDMIITTPLRVLNY